MEKLVLFPTPFNENFSQCPIRIFSKLLLAQCSIHIFIQGKKHVCRKNEGAVSNMNPMTAFFSTCNTS